MDHTRWQFPNDGDPQQFTFRLQAKSRIHMGTAFKRNQRLQEKGILGGLRWWTEAIIRAQGGYACDPTHHGDGQCTFKNHCAACEIFGCQELAKGFILHCVNLSHNYGKYAALPNDNITLLFTQTRLDNTLFRFLLSCAYLYFNHGAIGGRIGTKPSDHTPFHEKSDHHRDFGNLEVQSISGSLSGSAFSDFKTILPEYWDRKNTNEGDVKNTNHSVPPDFKYFFFYRFKEPFPYLEHFLTYERLNRHFFGLLMIKPGKWVWDESETREWVKFLRGNNYYSSKDDSRCSKKLFVYNDRLWGWQKNKKHLYATCSELVKVFGSDFDPQRFKTGEELLNEWTSINA